MASTPSARPQENSPLDLTRQMLDELDALMERMMALPVSGADDEPVADTIPAMPTVAATVTLLDLPLVPESQATAMQADVGFDASLPSPPATPPNEVHGAHPMQAETPYYFADWDPFSPPAAATKHVATPSPTVVESTSAEANPQPLPDELLPPTVLSKNVPPFEPVPVDERWLLGLALAPLYWLNGIFEGATGALGPIGKLLRAPAGRNLLGISGLVMLGLAIAWLVKDWLGWIW